MKELDFEGIKVWEAGGHDGSSKTYTVRINSGYIEKSISLFRKLKAKEIFIANEFKLDNIQFLQDFDLRNLKSIFIPNSISDLSPLYSVSNHLEKLGFNNSKKVELDLSKFKKLKFLGCDWNSRIINLQSCISLEKVKISKFSDSNLHQFSSLKKLKHLELTYSKLENLDGISKMADLEVLDLDSSRRLISLKGLSAKNDKLRDVRIYGAPNLIDAADVKYLKNLTRFNLARIKNIKSLKFLDECQKIDLCIIHPANVKVQDGDYSPLDKFKK